MPLSRGSKKHNDERDRIALQWNHLMPFTCAGCGAFQHLPPAVSTAIEVRYSGLLQADVVAYDQDANPIGTVEVIASHPPSLKALNKQAEMMKFACYRHVPHRSLPAAWSCSPACLAWYEEQRHLDADLTDQFAEAACSSCRRPFYRDPTTDATFTHQHNPHDAFCFACASQFGAALLWINDQNHSPTDLDLIRLLNARPDP